MTENTVHEDKDVELQKYELGYHLVPSLGEDDLALRVDELKKLITSLGGTLGVEGAPQSFVLSYTMKRLRGGKWDKYDSSFFGWIRFEALRERTAELEETLRTNEFFIRHLLVKVDTLEAAIPAIKQEEVVVQHQPLVKKSEVEEKAEVSEEQLDKQIKELIT